MIKKLPCQKENQNVDLNFVRTDSGHVGELKNLIEKEIDLTGAQCYNVSQLYLSAISSTLFIMIIALSEASVVRA